MRAYHKIIFSVGYEQDDGVGYQVAEDGAEVGLFSLAGEPLTLPKVYSFDFLEVDAPAPDWAV